MASGLSVFIILMMSWITYGNLTWDNVMFHKRNEVSSTRSTWKVSLVLRLDPYIEVTQRLYKTLGDISSALDDVLAKSGALNHIYDKSETTLLSNFLRLNMEINDLKKALDKYRDAFLENFLLKSRKNSKQKRSLIPFVGDAMSFLFGTVSDTDLSNIRRNLHLVATNQEKIAHVVKESLSIVNATQLEVAETRQTVNNLILEVSDIDDKLLNITTIIENKILDLEQTIQIYFQLDLALEEFKRALAEFSDQSSYFRLKLNLLAIGKLTPSLITPNQFKTLLTDIQKHLPHTLKLPSDVQDDLWHFYRIFSCETIIEDDHVLVLISIPLIDTNYELELYKVYNIPIPFQGNNDSISSSLVAQYSLETSMIAVDKRRTKIVLLDKTEHETCTKELIGFCAIKSPIYSIGQSKLCVVALFTKNQDRINKFCQVVISSNRNLPIANYIHDGMLIITTDKKLSFQVNCKEPLGSSDVIVKPPVGRLNLLPSCMAHSELLTLTPYYRLIGTSNVKYLVPKFLNDYNNTQFKFWNPVRQKFPNFTANRLPKKLSSVTKVPLDSFIDELNELSKVQEDEILPSWVYTVLLMVLITAVCLAVCVWKKVHCKGYKLRKSRALEGINSDTLQGAEQECIPLGIKNADRELVQGDMLFVPKVKTEPPKVASGQIANAIYPDLRT